MRVLIAILFGGCLLTPSALAQQQYYTKYFVRDSVEPSNVEYLCKVSLDQNALEYHLREAGGHWKDFKPSINWAEDMTITIATNRVYPAFDIALKDVTWDGYKRKKYVLRWGWWNSSQRRWWSPFWNGNSVSTKTVGTAKRRQILIVVVKRYLFTPTNWLVCEEYNGG
jgi:hypothetical protein